MNDISLRGQVLLSLQRALLGMVSENIRSVTCSWDSSMIKVKFIYAKEPSEEELDDAECVTSEVISDFPNHKIFTIHEQIDESQSLRGTALMAWAYEKKRIE